MKNEVIIKGDIAEIHIHSKRHGHFVTEVDTEDLPRIRAAFTTISISKAKNGFYARANFKGKQQLLHRFIINQKDETIIVDHLNNNPLCNLKSNLRECEQGENIMNSPNRGKYPKGVSWNNVMGKFSVRITYTKGKQTFLGYFDKLEEATLVATQAIEERGISYRGTY